MDNDLHVFHVDRNIPEFVERCCLNLPAHFPCPVPVNPIFRFEEHGHRGGARFLPRVHDLDQSGKAQGYVNLGNSCIVECPHRHLCARFPDRLCSNDSNRFTGFDPGILVFFDDTVQDLVKLGVGDLFSFEILPQLLLCLHREVCLVDLCFLIREHLTPPP